MELSFQYSVILCRICNFPDVIPISCMNSYNQVKGLLTPTCFSCHTVTAKCTHFQKQHSSWENRAALNISYGGNVWHSPPGTPSAAICTIIFSAISWTCVIMQGANRRMCRKEGSKPLSLGDPGVLRVDKCCQVLLSKLLEIVERELKRSGINRSLFISPVDNFLLTVSNPTVFKIRKELRN